MAANRNYNLVFKVKLREQKRSTNIIVEKVICKCAMSIFTGHVVNAKL